VESVGKSRAVFPVVPGRLDTIKQHGLQPTWSVEGYIGLAWSLWATGRAKAALEALQAATTIAQLAEASSSSELVDAHQTRLWLRQGKLDAASEQVRKVGLCSEDPVLYPRQFEYLTLARLLIQQGHAERAISLLDRYLLAALQAGRGGDVIEILALQALAYQAQGDLANASAALANALCRGEREGFIRTFVEEGMPMARLLQHSAAQGITLVYVRLLLAAFPHVVTSLKQDHFLSTGALIEPLSKREREVLRLVASGCRNEDIAQLLYISPTTVKKHLSNILGKLGAQNRTQAVAKARELQLIG
jgi:LuxR family maltose regulon positive regulatory protein